MSIKILLQHSEAQPLPSQNLMYMPVTRKKLAKEFGIDLNLIQPTGPKGRILKTDLHRFVQGSYLDKNLQALNSISQMLIILSGAR